MCIHNLKEKPIFFTGKTMKCSWPNRGEKKKKKESHKTNDLQLEMHLYTCLNG